MDDNLRNQYVEKIASKITEENIPFDDIREMAIRIMGRNYYSSLSAYIKNKFDQYLLSIKEETHYDHVGGKRNTAERSLDDIRNRLV